MIIVSMVVWSLSVVLMAVAGEEHWKFSDKLNLLASERERERERERVVMVSVSVGRLLGDAGLWAGTD